MAERGFSMKRIIVVLVAAVFYLFFLHDLERLIQERSSVSFLSETSVEEKAFREQRVSQDLYQRLQAAEKQDWIELLTSSMADSRFAPKKLTASGEVYRKYKAEEYEVLKKAYEAVWKDVKFFPVASGDTYFENTWMAKRGEKGERLHEGTDIFGRIPLSGYYPVVSMTDGVVEKIGWLPLGGYRIGIRAPHGGYFYYAHLSSYEKSFVPGEAVQAGDILGYMGNTGYGEEGTKGRFPVHLHLGIYIPTKNFPELSVNPYYLLRNFRKKIRNYAY